MKRFGIGMVALSLAACAPEMDENEKPAFSDVKPDQPQDGKFEAWGPSDAPGGFSSSLEYKIDALPREGAAQNAPWAGNYWPVYQDSINHKWAGASSKSAAAKYGEAFGVTGVEDGVSQAHGINSQSSRKACTTDADCTDLKDGSACAKRDGQTSGRCIPTWFGICHAWAPAAILVPEPKYPVTHNGVTFQVQDIKALVTLVHDRTNTKFVSLRCNKDLESGSEIAFDNYGRPDHNSPECEDTNAGTMHILLANYLGIQKAGFVYDRTIDDEVWNQPIRGFKVTSMNEVTAAQANAAIGVGAVGGTTVNKSAQVAQGAWSHQGSFTVAAGQNFKVAMKGTGDADLYVAFGSQPAANSYACRPYANGSTETCELVVPAGATQAFVSVHGYTAASFELQITSGGQLPSDYVFNPLAKKFYQVKAEVYYITESPGSLDGNLGNRIDDFTRTDKYDYILEVDAEGRIIGGEWVGASKTAHPDFLWLPLSHSGSSVAGGKITYANVKAIYDKSMVAPGGGGSTGGQKTVTESGTVAKGAWKHYGPFNVAAGTSFKVTMTGDNDADLYVRKTASPTLQSYDCRPYKNGSAEECTVTGGGVIYVGVNGYANSSSFTLNITYTEGTGGGGGTPDPGTVTHLNVSGNVALNEMKLHTVNVVAGRRIVVKTLSAVDVDLYIQMNGAPTTDAYLQRAWTSSGNETITYTPTSNGVLHIGVHGYAAGAFTLTTQD